jgi:hypothetical protein
MQGRNGGYRHISHLHMEIRLVAEDLLLVETTEFQRRRRPPSHGIWNFQTALLLGEGDASPPDLEEVAGTVALTDAIGRPIVAKFGQGVATAEQSDALPTNARKTTHLPMQIGETVWIGVKTDKVKLPKKRRSHATRPQASLQDCKK